MATTMGSPTETVPSGVCGMTTSAVYRSVTADWCVLVNVAESLAAGQQKSCRQRVPFDTQQPMPD